MRPFRMFTVDRCRWLLTINAHFVVDGWSVLFRLRLEDGVSLTRYETRVQPQSFTNHVLNFRHYTRENDAWKSPTLVLQLCGIFLNTEHQVECWVQWTVSALLRDYAQILDKYPGLHRAHESWVLEWEDGWRWSIWVFEDDYASSFTNLENKSHNFNYILVDFCLILR